MTQYVQVSFCAGGRLYIYHNDGPRLEAGQKVRIDTKDGWQKVLVVWVDVPKPTEFETKPLLWEDTP